MTAEQKVALAISGWLVGANQATDNFQTAVSLANARDKILRIPARAAGAESRRRWLPTCTTWKARRSSASRRC